MLNWIQKKLEQYQDRQPMTVDRQRKIEREISTHYVYAFRVCKSWPDLETLLTITREGKLALARCDMVGVRQSIAALKARQ